MNYKKEKIKKFHEYTIEDYKRSLVIEKIANIKLAEKTDETFTQIGIRPLLDEDIFISPSFSEYLPGAGRMIAIGERDFLIKTIFEKVENEEVEKKEFKENIKEFPKYIYEFDNPIILLSTRFYVEFFTELMHRIDYIEGYPRLDHQCKIIPVPEKVLENKIILIDKNAVWWEKQKFHDKHTNTDENIDISEPKSESGDKISVIIRSVNRLKISPELIKVVEVKG